jgi:hypothetical protein
MRTATYSLTIASCLATFVLACSGANPTLGGSDPSSAPGGSTAAGGSASVTGTGDSATDATENSDATEASASAAQDSRTQEMLFSNISSTSDPTIAASDAARQWWPAGCATRQRDATNPAVVHIHLDNCTGPFGLMHHTGDITVVFSKGANGDLHAEATSANMTVNGHAASYSASADISIDLTAKTVDVASNSAWTRDTAAGVTVSHTRQGTTVIDLVKRCRDTNGTAVTLVGSREIDSTLKDYTVCRKADGVDGCPTGEVTHTAKASGRTVTIDFDGSAEAKVTGPKGNSIEVPLVCVP